MTTLPDKPTLSDLTLSEASETHSSDSIDPVSFASEGPETPLPVRDAQESLAHELAWKKAWSARPSSEKAFDD